MARQRCFYDAILSRTSQDGVNSPGTSVLGACVFKAFAPFERDNTRILLSYLDGLACLTSVLVVHTEIGAPCFAGCRGMKGSE